MRVYQAWQSMNNSSSLPRSEHYKEWHNTIQLDWLLFDTPALCYVYMCQCVSQADNTPYSLLYSACNRLIIIISFVVRHSTTVLMSQIITKLPITEKKPAIANNNKTATLPYKHYWTTKRTSAVRPRDFVYQREVRTGKYINEGYRSPKLQQLV